jgi:hypothetical protein
MPHEHEHRLEIERFSFQAVLVSALHIVEQKGTCVDAGIEKYCEGCGKRHIGTVWYYQGSLDRITRKWLCGIKYLVLKEQARDLWKTFMIG